ncbi:MAG: serine/threonine protein kinase, partial [Myxococcota bacterium]
MVKIPDTEELVGATIAGRYRIDSVIGQGGMGSVFAATQLGIDRRVAVKVLRPPLHRDEAQAVRARTRFEREAKTLSRLSHPHTMRVFDYGHTESGNPYIVTELLEGKPLETVVEGEGSVAPIRAVRIISGVLKSLAEAHEAGIVHRDISAGNVFLVEVRDDPEFVKLIDFGLASDDTGGASVTRTGEILGTPLYMSPEQAQGKPTDERSDLYSTAVLLYEMLAGHAPFQHPNPLMVHIAHVERTPRNIQELVPGLPRALS